MHVVVVTAYEIVTDVFFTIRMRNDVSQNLWYSALTPSVQPEGTKCIFRAIKLEGIFVRVCGLALLISLSVLRFGRWGLTAHQNAASATDITSCIIMACGSNTLSSFPKSLWISNRLLRLTFLPQRVFHPRGKSECRAANSIRLRSDVIFMLARRIKIKPKLADLK